MSNINPEDYRIWIEAYTCSFHREFPGVEFRGCSCASAFGIHPKKPPQAYNAMDDLIEKAAPDDTETAQEVVDALRDFLNKS